MIIKCLTTTVESN